MAPKKAYFKETVAAVLANGENFVAANRAAVVLNREVWTPHQVARVLDVLALVEDINSFVKTRKTRG